MCFPITTTRQTPASSRPVSSNLPLFCPNIRSIQAAHPTIELGTTLSDYDGFLFGIPTRYGIWPAQWKTFLDSTGQIWSSGAYHGKMAALFTSTASQHGVRTFHSHRTMPFSTYHQGIKMGINLQVISRLFLFLQGLPCYGVRTNIYIYLILGSRDNRI